MAQRTHTRDTRLLSWYSWYIWALAVPTTLMITYWSIRNAPRVLKMIRQTEKSAMAFIEEHINEPAR
jgi:hypothetical protein